MLPSLDPHLLPFVIFCARIVDVSLGTLRTIAVVRGRVAVATLLAFFEVSIWIAVITQVMQHLGNVWNMLGWALGFAAGNTIGMLIERRLALGHLVVRILSKERGGEVAAALRQRGQRVVEFTGHDTEGDVALLYMVAGRSEANGLMRAARDTDPDCVVVSEDVRGYHQAIRPVAPPRGGWRSIGKRK
jgi:uncharacterized protein YebE (UPF0316 family)